TGTRTVRTSSPSFLAWGPGEGAGRTLFAVDESPRGRVVSLRADGERGLVVGAPVASGGEWPCHLLADPQGRALYVSNYQTGTLGVLTLGPDGGLSPEVRAAGGPLQVLAGAGDG